MSATAKAADKPRASKVEVPEVAEAKITTNINGKTTKPPICWAARISFTREETMTFASTLIMQAKGVIAPMMISQYKFGSRKMPRVVYDQ